MLNKIKTPTSCGLIRIEKNVVLTSLRLIIGRLKTECYFDLRQYMSNEVKEI